MEIALRQWCLDDANQLVSIADNPNVSRYLRNIFPNPYTLLDARQFIEFCLSNTKKDLFFAIEIDGKAAGGANIGFGSDVNEKMADIGYWIGEAYWGQGIGPEAVNQLCQIAFKQNDIERVEAEIFSDNIKSRRVLEKCNFQLDGTLRNRVYKHGRFYDSQIYSVLKNEYSSIHG